jgi:50S ribosomal subunit-associated GTPase HflX
MAKGKQELTECVDFISGLPNLLVQSFRFGKMMPDQRYYGCY